MQISNNNYLVSVGIPVVNSTYLTLAIQSCLNQTYTSLEVIILNNALTVEVGDEIEMIVNQFDDHRIKYYRNSSQLPMIDNWNKILCYSNGELFALLCDDDLWEPDFVLRLVALSIKYPLINLFHSRVLLIKGSGNCITSFLSPLCNEYEDSLDFIHHRIRGFRLQYVSDFLVRLRALKEIGGFVHLPDGWGSDDITWFTIAVKGGGVAYDSNLLFIYREHDDNTTNSKGIANKLESMKLYVDFVYSILFDIPICNDVENIKKIAILQELKIYRERRILDLIHKTLLMNSFVPNFIIPILMIFYRAYRHLNGSFKY
jgi:glycosyltransferase involved in cell wall biosynthesis